MKKRNSFLCVKLDNICTGTANIVTNNVPKHTAPDTIEISFWTPLEDHQEDELESSVQGVINRIKSLPEVKDVEWQGLGFFEIEVTLHGDNVLSQIQRANDDAATDIENPRTFSNGTEGMIWTGNNCDDCNRSACAVQGKTLDIGIAMKAAKAGRECWGKLALDFAVMGYGRIPRPIFDWIWPEGDTEKPCAHFVQLGTEEEKQTDNPDQLTFYNQPND